MFTGFFGFLTILPVFSYIITGLFGLICFLGFFIWEAIETPQRCKLKIKDVLLYVKEIMGLRFGKPKKPKTVTTIFCCHIRGAVKNYIADFFSETFFPKGTKNDVFVFNEVKNGPKRPYNRPKRAKFWEKFLDLK